MLVLMEAAARPRLQRGVCLTLHACMPCMQMQSVSATAAAVPQHVTDRIIVKLRDTGDQVTPVWRGLRFRKRLQRGLAVLKARNTTSAWAAIQAINKRARSGREWVVCSTTRACRPAGTCSFPRP